MERLVGKNILIIIPKDYYMERELDPVVESLKSEGANVLVASNKLKEAVGMKGGRTTPDVLIVDAIEGITGDSYVSAAKGVRQIKGVFHGVIVIGGNGARSYLWKDELVRLVLNDRHRSKMVVAAIGSAVPCLGKAELLQNLEVTTEPGNKKAIKELENAKAIIVDEPVTSHNRVYTVQNAEAISAFLNPFIEDVAKTALK
ncbi:DJ-1/PfpI family protein [Nitrospinaceae bacterium]|jgi:putative intracellular protease/amidase|nr:DJ-1/PfpI family protein [Nitrospinaceae bacterium]